MPMAEMRMDSPVTTTYATEGAPLQVPKGKTAVNDTYYYIIETLTRGDFLLVYFAWFCMLCGCIFVASYAPNFFSCSTLCDLEDSRSCPLMGTDFPPASCINTSKVDWWAVGLPKGSNSNFRRFSQWMIQAEGSNYSYNTSVIMTIYYYNENYSLLDVIEEAPLEKHTVASDNVWYTIPVTDDFGAMPKHTKYINFHFSDVPWIDRTGGDNSTDNFTGTRKSSMNNPSVLYVALQGDFGYMGSFYRIGWCGVCVLFLILHLRAVMSYVAVVKKDGMAMMLHPGTKLWRRVKQFFKLIPKDHLCLCIFQLCVAFSTDVLAIITAASRDRFWHYWSEHLMYWLQSSLQFTLFVTLALGMSSMHLPRRTFLWRVLAVAFSVSAIFLILDLISLRSSFDDLLSRPHSLAYENKHRYLPAMALGIRAALGLFTLWQYWYNCSSMVYNRGVALYSGAMRIRIIATRMFMGLTVLYVFCWFIVYQILTLESFFIPVYRIGGIIELTALTCTSCLFLLLLTPCKKSLTDYPPHPFSPLGYLVEECPTQLVDWIATQAADDQPSPAEAYAQRSWRQYMWTPAQFRTLKRIGFGGFYFHTEAEKDSFDIMLLNNAREGLHLRSFFCLETAFTCLNLSNEIYNIYSGHGICIKDDPSVMEKCLGKCCFTCGGEEKADNANYGDPTTTDDVPSQSPQSPPHPVPQRIDMHRHGYTLFKCISISGLQCAVCIRAGGDATSPLHKKPHVAVVFRGTANAGNALTDLNIVRQEWDEMSRCAPRARVHAGFLNAWIALRLVLHKQIGAAVALVPDPNASIIVTGHSLGGALAALCTYSLSACVTSTVAQSRKVVCYTYGMPRIGNTSFTNAFNALCPETYAVVNENDRVSTMWNCGRSHVGRRVSLDRDGNMIVEPSAVEKAYNVLSGAGSSLRNHLLDQYATAMEAVLRGLPGKVPFATFLSIPASPADRAPGELPQSAAPPTVPLLPPELKERRRTSGAGRQALANEDA